jgi:pyruvate formate lyase activating enzyme
MKKVKDLGFLVKLDTNGSNPEMVRELIKGRLVDYIAMDLKGPLTKYQNHAEHVETTIKILTESGLEFELRTTVVPTLHTKEDLLEMARELQTIGFVRWYLQQFSPKKCLDPRFETIKPYPKSFFEDSLSEIKKYVPTTFLRGV